MKLLATAEGGRLKKGALSGLMIALACASTPALGGTYDGNLGRTRYVLLTGDINNDGQNDVLMKAMPSVVFIPLDDELSVPITTAPASPSFALVSTAYGAYTLVTNPDAATMARVEWKAGTQQVTFYGAEGEFAGSVAIKAVSGEQASFVVSMAAASGQLQISSITPPAINNAPPGQTLPACD